jgi:hypothetical protein
METIETYVAAIQAAAQARYDALKYTIPAPKYSFNTGKRFYKVMENRPYSGGSSVHCFVEIATGDIYKPASWNTPAKGVRSNLQATDRPLLCGDYYR